MNPQVDRDAQQVSPGLILVAAACFKSLCKNMPKYTRQKGHKTYLTIKALNAVLVSVFGELLDKEGISIKDYFWCLDES